MGCVWKIKHWDAMEVEGAAVDLGIAAHVHHHFARIELPIGMRRLTSSDSAVENQVMIGAGLFHHLAGEGERRGRGQNYAVGAKAQSGGSGYVVKFSGFQIEVVSAARG